MGVQDGHQEAGAAVAGSVLLVGNPALPLKGFDVAIKALTTVNRVVPISLTWICQTQPTAANVPALVGSGLTIDLYISPRQVSAVQLLRRPSCRFWVCWLSLPAWPWRERFFIIDIVHWEQRLQSDLNRES